MMKSGIWHVDNVLNQIALISQEDERYVEPYHYGSMSLGMYAPYSQDLQEPHEQDELYFVLSGSGMFVKVSRNVPTYDANGRIASALNESTPDQGTTWNFADRIDFSYDASGRLNQKVYYWSSPATPSSRDTYTYQSSTDMIERVDNELWSSGFNDWLPSGDPNDYFFDGNNRLITISRTTSTGIETFRRDIINTDVGSSYTWEQFLKAFREWVPNFYGYGAPVTQTY